MKIYTVEQFLLFVLCAGPKLMFWIGLEIDARNAHPEDDNKGKEPKS